MIIMKKTIQYEPQGVCSVFYEITLNDDIIEDIQIVGGCHGNLQGIAKLITGMNRIEVIEKLSGIKCGFKPTSCPDQIARALKSAEEL